MATHTHLPAIAEHGLQDGCERCAEHASHPFASLDNDNLRALVERTCRWLDDDDQEAAPRSQTELAAMRCVEEVLLGARRILRIGMSINCELQNPARGVQRSR